MIGFGGWRSVGRYQQVKKVTDYGCFMCVFVSERRHLRVPVAGQPGWQICSRRLQRVLRRHESFIVLKCNQKTVLPRINARTLGNGPGRQVKADVCVVVAAKTA